MIFTLGDWVIELKWNRTIVVLLLMILILGVPLFFMFFNIPGININPVILTTIFLGGVCLFLLIFIMSIFMKFDIIPKIKNSLTLNEGFLTFISSLEENGKKMLMVFVIIVVLILGGMYISKISTGTNLGGLSVSEIDVEVEDVSKTTSTTTTTKKKKDSGGFFTFRNKDKDSPKDCTFAGKGHDAVLMPSGNYYCRSTEQRISIYVDGVERICCVTP